MKWLAGILSLIVLTGNARAQFLPAGAPPTGFERFILTLFGGQPSFVASGTLHIQDANENNLANIACQIDALGSNMFIQMNGFFPGSNAAPVANMMKEMRSSDILRPDLQREYLVYPMFQSYVEMELTTKAPGGGEPYPHLSKLVLGKESLNGHDCQKSQWTVSDSQGAEQKVMVWTENDLRNFPVVLKFPSSTNLVELDVSAVDFSPPPATVFEVPAGYFKYEAIQSQIVSNVASQLTNASNVVLLRK